MIKLLLVDDVELFLELERSFLSREIFEIATARSGREALEKVRRVRPDLVLLDLFMPEIDGAEVCRSLKADPDTRNIPVIMTTSEPQEEPDVRKRCFEAGCDDFIPKPLRREELLKVIGDALQLTKRREPRVKAHLRCAVTRSGETTDTWIHTLAVRGASVQFPLPLRVGEEIDLLFSLPMDAARIETRAVVRWVGRAAKNGPPGVGVEFLTIATGDRERINTYVAEKLKLLEQ
ncbi:MAG: response regulator [Deltaproteobacteria bacterium]|nr:response regulator [Deltaproteobacteria bacterium]